MINYSLMLHLLPAEIVIHIASYLPLQSLYQVLLVSREWHSLLADNAQTVYRNAAILHRFIFPADLNIESSCQKPNYNRDWIQFCRRQLEIEYGWRGKASCTANELTATGKFVLRIKVDENEGFAITTCHTRGIYVTDIDTNRVLWAEDIHVPGYVHCEYDHGYLVVNRHDSCKEVWRLARDFRVSDIPKEFKPDQSMINASDRAARRYASSTNHGHFRPWALLQMPESTCVFRLSYPNLIIANSSNAYLWDVSTSHLVETIRNLQMRNNHGILGQLNYVDVNDHYAFFCGSVQFRIFARSGGALVYHLTKTMLPRTQWNVLPKNNIACLSSLLQPQQLQEAFCASKSPTSNFKAAHVSSSGKDLVVLTTSGIFIWIPGFERLIRDEVVFNEIAVVLNFNPSPGHGQDISIYLALGGSNEKATIATRKGIYIIALDPEISKLTAGAPPRPGVSVCRVMTYDRSLFLSFITCLQMTHTGIFFNWCPSSEQNRFSRPVGPTTDQFLSINPSMVYHIHV